MTKDESFENPHTKITKQIDGILGSEPLELQKVTDNLEFIKRIKEKPLPKNVGEQKVFGFEIVNVNAILKDNIWNRSIFTVDKLCKMFLKATLEQQKKYLAKKRHLDFNYWWLIILLIGVPIALILLIFLLPMLGGIVP